MSTPDPVSPNVCDQCGATVPEGTSCHDRFMALLALDHSRKEPWGSRHALAFAVFTLQHARDSSREQRERCLAILRRVYVEGEDLGHVTSALRRQSATGLSASPEPQRERPPTHFAVTIQDMGDFDAETYVAKLDAWCRATLRAWSK